MNSAPLLSQPKNLRVQPSGIVAPFLIPDLAQTKSLIEKFTGRWRRRWDSFQQTARLENRTARWYGSDSADTPLHATFCWLVTGSEEMKEIARRDVFWMLDRYSDTLKVGAQDHDTWIYAAAMARRAIGADWAWELFDNAEQERIAEHFVTDSVKYPYVTLHHRIPSHANNQGMAMALNLVIIGYLFGFRHGSDERARHLLTFGLRHLIDQIALLPPGGYGGEGSTYCVFVADPLMALACAAVEEITGEPFFDRPLAPNGNCPRKILTLGHHILPPSGIYPGWDQHGFTLRRVGATACYLARRIDDPAYAEEVLHGDAWELSGHFAWLRDDHVWQLAWHPNLGARNRPINGHSEATWAEPRVGGTITSAARELHLFQTWDISGRRPVRLHMNPNAVHLEAWGSLLTVDGNALEEFSLNADPRMHYTHLYSETAKTMSWASGSIAAHSCIQIDQMADLTAPAGGFLNLPNEVATGFLVECTSQGDRKTLSADCAPQLADLGTVQSCIRSSHLVSDLFWVIVDQIEASKEHEFTWQLVLREGASLAPHGARLTTAEGVVMDIFHLDDCSATLEHVPGYPNSLEGRCHHLRKSRWGQSVEFCTLLVPQLAREVLADWTRGWMMKADPENHGIRDRWIRPVPRPGARTADFSDAHHMRPHLIATGGRPIFWFWQEFSHCDDTGSFLLELPRAHEVRLWIDGEEIAIPAMLSGHQNGIRLQSPFLDVTAHLRGRTSITLVLRFELGNSLGIIGNVKLHRKKDIPVPVLRHLSTDCFLLSIGGKDYELSKSSFRVQPHPKPKYSATGELPDHCFRSLSARISDQPGLSLQWSTSRVSCALESSDWSEQLLAVKTLGMTRCREGVPALQRLLRTESSLRTKSQEHPPKYRLKELCIWALHQIGDPSVAEDVAACMNPEEFYGVRRLAADALGELGNPTHLNLLVRWSDDPDYETAQASLRSSDRIRSRSK